YLPTAPAALATARTARRAIEEDYVPTITYADALREAIQEEMRSDERVFIMGEDINAYGGSYTVTKGLVAEFGTKRVRDTPLAEAVIVGAGVGAAMGGL